MNNDPKLDAALYLLTALMQRIESRDPGVVQDLIDGVEGDRASMPDQVENRPHIEAVFDEELELLKRANRV